jgi:hypothetical protein
VRDGCSRCGNRDTRLVTAKARAAEPADDALEVAVGVEAVITFQLAGDVCGVGVIEQHDADVVDHAAGFVDAMPQIVGLTRRAEAGARRLLLLEALKPLARAHHEHVFGLECAVAAPFVPPVIRAAGVFLQEELIEDNVDATAARRSPKLRTRWR